jgi:hypothetical protein
LKSPYWRPYCSCYAYICNSKHQASASRMPCLVMLWMGPGALCKHIYWPGTQHASAYLWELNCLDLPCRSALLLSLLSALQLPCVVQHLTADAAGTFK